MSSPGDKTRIDDAPKAPAPRHDLHLLLFALFLAHSMLFQIATSVTRITTSYRSIELDLSYVWYGAISSGYALLPIFLAVPVGRYMSGGHDARVIWIGAALALGANIGLWAYPANAPLLLLYSVIAGVGHLVPDGRSPDAEPALLGADQPGIRSGLVHGPAVAWPDGGAGHRGLGGGRCAAAANRLVVPDRSGRLGDRHGGALLIRPARRSADAKAAPPPMSARDVLASNGLKIVILASVVTVTSMDIIVIYMPLLGIERHIDAWHVGVALMIRGVASIGARLFYERLLRAMGRSGLSMWTMMIAAAGFVLLALPAPLMVTYLASAMIGFGAGLAVTVCLSNVVAMTPPQGRATALTLRLSGNRIGQFIFPVAASTLPTVTGVGGVFLLVAAALAASGASMRQLTSQPKD
jgi:MFS family permease